VIAEMRTVASEDGASILTITHDAAVQAMFPVCAHIQDVVKSLEGA
jgi:ABC-type dipeptide/oligopeptide/nickel transport system ATPase component